MKALLFIPKSRSTAPPAYFPATGRAAIDGVIRTAGPRPLLLVVVVVVIPVVMIVIVLIIVTAAILLVMILAVDVNGNTHTAVLIGPAAHPEGGNRP